MSVGIRIVNANAALLCRRGCRLRQPMPLPLGEVLSEAERAISGSEGQKVSKADLPDLTRQLFQRESHAHPTIKLT